MTEQPKSDVSQTLDIDEKERAIIAAARETFLSKGFDGASMDAIAFAASVSKRTVYNRFRSKEALFAAAITQSCMSILPLNVGEIEATRPPIEFITKMAHIFVRGILSDEAISLKRIAAFEAARTPAIGQAYLEHGPLWLAAACRPLLERVADKGLLAIEDFDVAIWQLGALITEPLYTQIILGVLPGDVDAAIEKQVASGLSAFWKIYGAETPVAFK